MNTAELRNASVQWHHASIVETSDDAIIFVDPERVILASNSAARRMFDCETDEAIGRSIASVVSPDFQRAVSEILERVQIGQPVDDRRMRHVSRNATAIDLSISVRPVRNAEAEVVGASIVARNVTEHKLAEAALSTMSGQLIEAQEKERTWIARELHDDIGQRLSMLMMHVQSLFYRSSLSEIQAGIQKAIQQISELVSETRALSHRFYSPSLDYAGLEAATSAYCGELNELHNMKINFHSEDIPTDLPPEVSLCLYRVLQECLQNAMKHSGSRHFQVLLRGGAGEIELMVQDRGIGFEPEQAFNGSGIGLSNMKERLKLVNGVLSIDSELGIGTRIHARAPLRAKALGAG
jgi:PAS domain S-box-containing protein